MILLNPKKHDREYPDERSKEIMLKTIEFFEKKGRQKIKEDDHERVWYEDFLKFIKEEGIFATLLTPPEYGDEDSRWDTWRICEFNEILAFYGLAYWYTWQVSILGLGPIWMSQNEEAKRKAAKLLKDGAIFAFGLSEREHGADIYSTEMSLTPKEYSEIGKQDAPKNDDFLFNQGSTHGLRKIQFHDYHIAFDSYDLPNVNVFKEQIEVFKEWGASKGF